MEQGPLTALTKAIETLRVVADAEEPPGLARIVAAVGQPKPSVRRSLLDLIKQSYVVQNRELGYELGNGLIDIAASALSGPGLLEQVRPELSALRSQVRATIVVWRYVGHGLAQLAQFDGPANYAATPAPGGPMYATAAGKAVLAHLGATDVDRLVPKRLDTLASGAARSRTQLLQELKGIRLRGVATEEEEARIGVQAVAAPVFGFTGLPVMAVSLVEPARATSIDELLDHAPALTLAAKRMSRSLGAPEPIEEN